MGYGIQAWDVNGQLIFDSSKDYCFVRIFQSVVRFKRVGIQTYRCEINALNLSSESNHVKVRNSTYLIYSAKVTGIDSVEVKMVDTGDEVDLNLSIYRC